MSLGYNFGAIGNFWIRPENSAACFWLGSGVPSFRILAAWLALVELAVRPAGRWSNRA
jgi:hypothetical protein